MEMLGDEWIKSRREVGSATLTIKDAPTDVRIMEADVNLHDFPLILLATSPAYQGEMLGWAGFALPWASDLLLVEPSFLEMKMLKVDPAYFGCRVGTTLLDYCKTLAKEQDRCLILRPDRPGKGFVERYRKNTIH